MMGSPWLEEYERHRPVLMLSGKDSADVAIIGGGISGLLTAYRLLEGTGLTVTVLERDLVGHGATGHNAGQVVAAFEQGYRELSATLGQDRTDQGYRELGGAWSVLERILADIKQPPLRMVVAQLGIGQAEGIRYWMEEREARHRLGLPIGTLRLADDIAHPVGLEAERVSRSELDRLLWARGRGYVAALELKVGLLNSYVLAEVLAESLLDRYPERFRVYEHSPVERVKMAREGAAASIGSNMFRAGKVVLCTNGYRLPIIESGAAIEGRVQGSVGYMVGATSDAGHAGARAYFQGVEGSYFYLTRREHADSWMTSVGGPEESLNRESEPTRTQQADAFRRIEEFIEHDLAGPLGFRDHYWMGLMGYTPSGVRVVGRDPTMHSLFYNLGCNGIGLLSGVVGADRLARMMNGEDLPPSMFDPEVALLLHKEKAAQRVR